MAPGGRWRRQLEVRWRVVVRGWAHLGLTAGRQHPPAPLSADPSADLPADPPADPPACWRPARRSSRLPCLSCMPCLPSPPALLPMTFSLPNTASRQRRRWSTLLLLALVLVTGLSLSMTRQQGARLAEVDELILPSVRLVHEMTVVVDEARGLSALHLLRADPVERQDLEDRLQAARQRIERRMAASRQRLADDTERRHFQRVRASLSAYWAAQDRLLAASRLAVDGVGNRRCTGMLWWVGGWVGGPPGPDHRPTVPARPRPPTRPLTHPLKMAPLGVVGQPLA